MQTEEIIAESNSINSKDEVPITMPIKIEDKEFHAGLIDTGAGISLITLKVFNSIQHCSGVKVLDYEDSKLRTANRTEMQVFHTIIAVVDIAGVKRRIKFKVRECVHEVILGVGAMKAFGMIIHTREGFVEVEGTIFIHPSDRCFPQRSARLRT